MPRHRDITNASIHQASFVDSSDPSGVYSGEDLTNKLWIDRSTSPRMIKLRKADDSGWETIGFYVGTGSPEGVVTATVGFLYLRTDGSTSTTLYVKTSGSGNTGWTAK